MNAKVSKIFAIFTLTALLVLGTACEKQPETAEAYTPDTLAEQALQLASTFDELLVKESADAINYTISQDTTAQIVLFLGEQCYTVGAADGCCNLANPAPAEAFGASLAGDAPAGLQLVLINSDGGVSLLEFSHDAAGDTLRIARVARDARGAAYVENTYSYALEALRYTEKGSLIYRRAVSAGFSSSPQYVPYTILRVKPLDEPCRAACKEYVFNFGYRMNNVLSVNWSQSDFSQLDFAAAFPYCYLLLTGEPLTLHSQLPYDYDEVDGLLVPKAEFERIIQEFFPVETKTLESLTAYDAENGCYRVHLVTSSDLSASQPESEVVACTENPDGTLTLQVDAVSAYVGDDRLFSSLLLLRPEEDGTVTYLSNTIIK